MCQSFCADDVDESSADGDAHGYGEAAEGFAAVDEDECESSHCEEGRQGVERNAEGTRQVRLLHAQNHDANVLQEELQQDAGDDQHGDDLLKAEEAEDRSDQTEGYEGAVGDSVARMNGSEKAEIVAALRGGKGNARVAEQQRKDRGECRPHDESGDGVASPLAKS